MGAGAGAGRVALVVALTAATATTAACGGGGSDPKAPSSLTIPLSVGKMKLPNGLVVVLDEDHHTPSVAVNVSYHVGGKDDPRGRSGFAHLFEHLMFQGSAHVKKGELDERLQAAGVQDRNGHTGLDRTVYYEVLPSNQLDLALWLESDRMGFLLASLDQANFDRERNVVKNEWRQNYATRELGFVREIMRSRLFPGDHPYARLPIGTPEELDAATLDDVRAFFSTWYVPSNATLTVVGDFRTADAVKSINRYFASLPTHAVPNDAERRRPRPTTLTGTARITIEADVVDRRVIVEYAAPPWFTQEYADANIAFDMAGSLVHWWLVDEHEWATDVSWGCEPAELASVCQMSVRLKAGAPPDRVLGAIETALSDKSQADVPRRWVVQSVNAETAELVFDFESLRDRADQYGRYEQATGNPVFLARWMAKLTSVDRSDVYDARKKYFAGGHVAALVEPVHGAPIGGRLTTRGAW